MSSLVGPDEDDPGGKPPVPDDVQDAVRTLIRWARRMDACTTCSISHHPTPSTKGAAPSTSSCEDSLP
jgi:hypothetical protein